ncbi:ParA family protein [Candidatus Parabeggiatoa sp. HSG14]|uniref:ParA family protein n=1 Tax=Candidatus Parabeggiatoa sp. HSG14 TaxID=3055593 RepID=UPI0025A8DA26|nr:ParA family protein [Thiotrichales bacterium HSG14]
MPLSSQWDIEAYVSVHLVQEMLIKAGIPKRLGGMICWHPEFRIKVPKIDGTGFTEKKVDFLIEDHTRHVSFLIEVKSAKQRINDEARFQLVEKYLYRSNIKFGVLIDPFSIEIYEYGQSKPKARFEIEDPNHIEPLATFLKTFLETVKMRTIAIHTSKGGVGKTTLTINMAYELAKQGNKVLVVDLDDQANASLSLGVNKADEIDAASSLEEVERILDSFEERQELVEFLLECVEKDFDYRKYIHSSSFNTYLENRDGKVDVLPGSYKTKSHSLEEVASGEKRLDKGLLKLAGEYDYCLIDTPPTYNRITWNGIFAAQYIVIPSQMEYLSVYGIRNPIRKTREVREDTGEARGIILGIVPMMTDNTTKIVKTILALVEKNFPNIPLLTKVERATDIREASYQRVPISVRAEHTSKAGGVAKQLADLTRDIVERIDSLESEKGV